MRNSSYVSLGVGASLAILFLPSHVLGDDKSAVRELSTACEIALARSAAPKRLREDISVMTPDSGRYQMTVEGSGPLTCIVERNHPMSIVPMCMDDVGVTSVLPAIVHRSEAVLAGRDPKAVIAEHATKLEAGEYSAASKAGVSYMMSNFTYTYFPDSDEIKKIPAHVMFYAPHATNEQIGGSFQGMSENIGTPFVFREGLHGYFIVYTEHHADTSEVAAACEGELGESPPEFRPFSKG